MALEKASRILLPLAMTAVLAVSAVAQEHPNITPDKVRGQLMQAPQGSQASSAPQVQPPPQKPAAPSAPAPKAPAAQAPAKAPAATEAKAPVKKHAKTAAAANSAAKAAAAPKDKEIVKAAPSAPAKPPVEKPAEEKASGPKRDPFDSLLMKASAGGNASPENLPPGKAGLVVGTLRIDGIVAGPNGMIAIVSNPQQRTYFLREGDKLYDGSVDKITLEAVSFHEFGKDAFGKPMERIVAKRLYPSPGEQR